MYKFFTLCIFAAVCELDHVICLSPISRISCYYRVKLYCTCFIWEISLNLFRSLEICDSQEKVKEDFSTTLSHICNSTDLGTVLSCLE